MYGRCQSCKSPLPSRTKIVKERGSAFADTSRCESCLKAIHQRALDKINAMWDRMVDLDGKA